MTCFVQGIHFVYATCPYALSINKWVFVIVLKQPQIDLLISLQSAEVVTRAICYRILQNYSL